MKYIEDIRAHFAKNLSAFQEQLNGEWEKAAKEEGWEPLPLEEGERETIEETIAALEDAIGILDGLSPAAVRLLGLVQRPSDWPKGLSETELNLERTMAMLGSGASTETAMKLDVELGRRRKTKDAE